MRFIVPFLVFSLGVANAGESSFDRVFKEKIEKAVSKVEAVVRDKSEDPEFLYNWEPGKIGEISEFNRFLDDESRDKLRPKHLALLFRYYRAMESAKDLIKPLTEEDAESGYLENVEIFALSKRIYDTRTHNSKKIKALDQNQAQMLKMIDVKIRENEMALLAWPSDMIAKKLRAGRKNLDETRIYVSNRVYDGSVPIKYAHKTSK